jgi:hypothetical protein
MWIDNETLDIAQQLNQLFVKIHREISREPDKIENIGQNHFQNITTLRNDLEESLKKNLYNLHDIETILKQKKRS